MKDIEYYTRIGKEHLDLKGTELRQWVSDQMKQDRQDEEKARKAEEFMFIARVVCFGSFWTESCYVWENKVWVFLF